MVTRYGVDGSGLDGQIGQVRLKIDPARTQLAARHPQCLGRKVDAHPPLEVVTEFEIFFVRDRAATCVKEKAPARAGSGC